MKGKISTAEEARGTAVPVMSLSGRSLPEGRPNEKAFSELITKGAEEIQDHLSLVARTQVRIRTLLQNSIEELERAQRLETLTSLISGSGSEPDHDSHPEKADESPGAYLEHEIKTLKRMQKLLGVRNLSEDEPKVTGAVLSDALSMGAGEAESDIARKILIINHDPGTIRILRYFLEKEDYGVLTCSNGPEGVKKAAQERPDLILLDILLPGMDGYQVLRRLKRNDETSRIPVFVLSVLAQEADILKAIEGGAADYFIKPFSPHIIIAKIRRAVGGRP